MTAQLDMFELSEIEKLQQQVIEYKKSNDNVRRGLFARHGALAEMFMDSSTKIIELEEKVNMLEAMILKLIK